MFDERLAKNTNPVSKITYLSKSIVQDLDDLKKTEAYAKAYAKEQRTANAAIGTGTAKATKWRPIILGIFLVASIFPLWILVKRRQKPRT